MTLVRCGSFWQTSLWPTTKLGWKMNDIKISATHLIYSQRCSSCSKVIIAETKQKKKHLFLFFPELRIQTWQITWQVKAKSQADSSHCSQVLNNRAFYTRGLRTRRQDAFWHIRTSAKWSPWKLINVSTNEVSWEGEYMLQERPRVVHVVVWPLQMAGQGVLTR